MSYVLLMKSDRVKEITGISHNITVSTPIEPFIREAQEEYIRPLLCEPFFLELQDQVLNNTLTSDNRILLEEYIYFALAFYTEYRMTYKMWAKYREQGVVNLTGSTANTVSFTDLKPLKFESHLTAKRNGAILLRYLKKNKDLYPLWSECCGCESGPNSVAPSQQNPFFFTI